MNLPISTERLVLRPLREADLEKFLAYRNDPEVARFQSWDGLSRDATAAFLRSHPVFSPSAPGQ